MQLPLLPGNGRICEEIDTMCGGPTHVDSCRMLREVIDHSYKWRRVALFTPRHD